MGRILVCLLIALVLVAPPAARGQAAQNVDPADAVFQVLIVARDTYKELGYGTAFFTGSDGTALTVSHVVYRAQQDAAHYDLLAIVNKEFYSVDIVCASKLPYDPTKQNAVAGVPYGRDVAQIKVVPSRFSFRSWLLTLKTGEKLTLATAHRDALPAFPYLTVGAGRAQATTSTSSASDTSRRSRASSSRPARSTGWAGRPTAPRSSRRGSRAARSPATAARRSSTNGMR